MKNFKNLVLRLLSEFTLCFFVNFCYNKNIVNRLCYLLLIKHLINVNKKIKKIVQIFKKTWYSIITEGDKVSKVHFMQYKQIVNLL